MKQRVKQKSWLAALAFSAALSLTGTQALASENGSSFYLLGSKGTMAGVVPAPGLYLQNDVYYYTARADASQSLPTGGQVAVGLKAQALINLPALAPPWAPSAIIISRSAMTAETARCLADFADARPPLGSRPAMHSSGKTHPSRRA